MDLFTSDDAIVWVWPEAGFCRPSSLACLRRNGIIVPEPTTTISLGRITGDRRKILGTVKSSTNAEAARMMQELQANKTKI